MGKCQGAKFWKATPTQFVVLENTNHERDMTETNKHEGPKHTMKEHLERYNQSHQALTENFDTQEERVESEDNNARNNEC